MSEVDVAMAVRNAEEYLLKIKKKNKFSSFDMLRYKTYSNHALISDLPPTSATIYLHILRAFYVTYQQINLLNQDRELLDPELFGYCVIDEYIVAKEISVLYPPLDQLLPTLKIP